MFRGFKKSSNHIPEALSWTASCTIMGTCHQWQKHTPARANMKTHKGPYEDYSLFELDLIMVPFLLEGAYGHSHDSFRDSAPFSPEPLEGGPLQGDSVGSMALSGGFPTLGGTSLRVPIIIRIIVYWGLHWGPPVLGNYHLDFLLLV